MDAREEVAQLIEESKDFEKEPNRYLLLAALRLLSAVDEDLQKLRKELRTINGGEKSGTSEAIEAQMGHRKARGEAFRLSREERNYVAGHALDSVAQLAEFLQHAIKPDVVPENPEGGSDAARKITALSNLLGDIGWERRAVFPNSEDPQLDVAEGEASWILGELFPVAQLRPWLEEWQRQDDKALADHEANLEVAKLAVDPTIEPVVRANIAKAQTKLGTGAILLARIEKWMTSHDN
jgi:hypothetical protein